jgi:signal transduction histidine kinase
VDIAVEADVASVRATVTDNGVGSVLLHRTGGKGVDNMAMRAEALGGRLELMPGAMGRGTVVRWEVPIAHPRPEDAGT